MASVPRRRLKPVMIGVYLYLERNPFASSRTGALSRHFHSTQVAEARAAQASGVVLARDRGDHHVGWHAREREADRHTDVETLVELRVFHWEAHRHRLHEPGDVFVGQDDDV